jgi:sulfonate transport system substrate-binding protein
MRSPRSLAAALAAILLLAAPAGAAEPVTIRVAWVAVVSNMPSILFLKPGIARHDGKRYIFEATHYASTPLMIPAMATNNLEIGTLAYSSLAAAINNAGISDLRVIADEFQDGTEGYYSDDYMVRKDSPIRTVADLKGKILATAGAGGAMDMALRVMLKKNNLDPKRDVTMVEVSMPNHRAALGDGKVDLISSPLPFSQEPELQRIARTLFKQRDAIGTTQMIIWAARAGFLEKNRAAVVDFLEDTIRARRYFTDPANHAEVVQLVSQFTKQPPDRYDGWLFTKNRDYYRDPDALPDLAALRRNIDVQHELGFLSAPIEIEQYTDLSLVKEAAARVNGKH